MNQIFYLKSFCMYCKVFSLVVSIFYNIHAASANNIYEPTNARSAGLAGVSASITGSWSVYGNQAGLAGTHSDMVGVHYENYYSVAELNRCAAIMTFSHRRNSFGAGYTYFGNERLNYSKTSVIYARSVIEQLLFGFSIDFFMFRSAGETEDFKAPSAQLGLMMLPVENLTIGVHIYNLAGDIINSELLNDLPRIGTLGVSYRIDGLVMMCDVRMRSNGKPTIKSGLEINMINSLFLRLGISTSDYAGYSAGLGYKLGHVKADVAFSRHPYLGFSPYISLSYYFSDDEQKD